MYEEKFQIKIKSNSPLPLYFQIKEDLKSKIENGILNEGEYLPSEFKLMEQYGVSRPTIRQAVENLCQENFLEKQRGIGTMVKSKNSDLPQEILVIYSISMKKLKRNPIYLQRMFLNFVLSHPILL